MTYKPIATSRAKRWLWAALVFGMFAVALMWFLWDPIPGKTRAPEQQQPAPSTEWTTAPEGEHVEVDLPDTPVRVVPNTGESTAVAPDAANGAETADSDAQP